MVLVVVIVVVILAVIGGVVGVVLLRSLPHSGTSAFGPAPVGTALDEAAAARAGDARENSTSGGPWSATAIYGLGLSGGYNGSSGFVPGCSTVWENGSNLLVPVTPTSAAAGFVSGWLFFAKNPSSELLITAVYQTGTAITASNVIILQGSCITAFTALGPVPSSIVDSTTVVASTNSMGGSTFLSSHTVQAVSLIVLGDYWSVEYTTCSFFAPSGSGENYTAIFDATTGATLAPGSTVSALC